MKEATARIKINKLLEAAGWRFFQEGNAPANIRLEPSVTIKSIDLDALGDDFEKTTKGFVDFLLFDARGFPLLVLEAICLKPHGRPRCRLEARAPHWRSPSFLDLQAGIDSENGSAGLGGLHNDGHLTVSTPIEFPPGKVLPDAAPLLEEERDFRRSALA